VDGRGARARVVSPSNGPASLQVGQPFNPFGLFVGIFIPEALVRTKDISPGAKVAYGRLVRYAGQDGDCHPSVKSIAQEIGVKERQAQRYLAELEMNGFIRTFARFKGPNIRDTNGYLFLWCEALAGSVRNSKPGVKCDTGPVSRRSPPLASLLTPKESPEEESQIEESPSSLTEQLGVQQQPPPTPSVSPMEKTYLQMSTANQCPQESIGKAVRTS